MHVRDNMIERDIILTHQSAVSCAVRSMVLPILLPRFTHISIPMDDLFPWPS